MNTIQVIGLTEKFNAFDSMDKRMDALEKIPLDHCNWTSYPYTPKVKFSIAHTGDHLLLKYFVAEQAIRAINTESNAPVFEDSCVEFFLSLPGKTAYYNLECNCLGTILLGYGSGRSQREMLPAEMIKKIIRKATIFKTDQAFVEWELFLKIPLEVFMYDEISSLEGITCRGNFYKCGDLLPEPHFLSWNPIISPQPDFHLPDYFGKLVFLPTIN